MLALPLTIVAPLVAGYVLSGLLRAGPGTVRPSTCCGPAWLWAGRWGPRRAPSRLAGRRG